MRKTVKLVPLERQREDREVMRWLLSEGVMPWEIANLRVGSVDESKKLIHVCPNFTKWGYNFRTKAEFENKQERERWISFAGLPFEYRLAHGVIYSSLLFTKRFPFSHLDDLCGYSIDEIEELTGVDYLEEFDKRVLTNREQFGNIEVTKANIKSQEQESGTKNKRHIRMPTV